jgi:hypothetical protein
MAEYDRSNVRIRDLLVAERFAPTSGFFRDWALLVASIRGLAARANPVGEKR